MASPTSSQLINWDSYNRALAEIKLQDNYGSAFKILNNAEMNAEQVAQLPVPTGADAYGYKNFADGARATWYSNYSSTVENVPDVVSQMNSNAGAGATNTYNWQYSANTDFSGGTGGGGTGSTFYGSDVTPAGGASSAISFLQNTVTPAVAATGLGIKLGKTVDSLLYNANPDFWDNVGLSSLNPETWNGITIDMADSGWEGVLKRGFNALLGIDTDQKTAQMYIDADAAAYLAMYMDYKGVFARAAGKKPPSGVATPDGTYPLPPYKAYTSAKVQSPNANYPSTIYEMYHPTFFGLNTTRGTEVLTYGDTPNQVVGIAHEYNYITGVETGTSQLTAGTTAYDIGGNTIYVCRNFGSAYGQNLEPAEVITKSATNRSFIEWVLKYGDTIGAIDGIGNQPDAVQPDFSGCQSPSDYKQAMQQQYPSMFSNAVTQNVAQPDGSVITHTYIPVGLPTGTGDQPTTNPDTTGQSQTDSKTETETAPQELLETLLKIISDTYTPTNTPNPPSQNPPDTGNGDTPTVVTPTGQASSLFAIYNPTQAELNSFGGWLWSANFVDQLLKLFNDPMQSIIGLHKIFATPTISGTSTIHVGYLDSGVSSKTVGAQYTDIDCGTVRILEQFGNVFDYTDTHVRLYLPFIGIVDLDTSDVMRGAVSVVYHVDVITGACLAEVRITRDGSGGTLYQYAGDAAVRYPISSGSYMGVVSGVLSAVGGVASAVMTGGATLPIAAGAVAGGMSQAKTQVQHSGNFSGCAGAMGIKKPYLIIERPQTMIADGFEGYQGRGANVRRTVGQMSGYFKFSDVHTDSITGAAESEIETIRAALESGVIA